LLFIDELCRYCKNLLYIGVTGQVNIVKLDIVKVAKSCTRLHTLELNRAAFGQSEIVKFARFAANLRSVYICDNPSIADSSLVGVCMARPSIQALELNNCVNVSKAGLLESVKHCKILTKLTMHDSTWTFQHNTPAHNAYIKQLQDACPSLVTINVFRS